MSRHARSSPHSHLARLSSTCTQSPHRKRVFAAGIAARRLQHKQEFARTSCHARSSPHSHPARLRRACTRSPRRRRIFVASIAARRLKRKQETARMSRHARSSPHSYPARLLGTHLKPAPQARFRRRYCSPQASAQAGNRAHVTPRAFIAAFPPHASP